MKKVGGNVIDASHSISRNIAEGYCRKSIKEYLNHLNIALGSCGELFSGCFSLLKIEKISSDEFEKIDQLHFKVENQLIKLIKTLQNKQKDGTWQDSFIPNNSQI